MNRKCLSDMCCGLFRMSHSEDGDLSPSGPAEWFTVTPRDKPQRLSSKHTRPFLFYFSASHVCFLSHNSARISEVTSRLGHVLQQVALTLLLFISLQRRVPQKKRRGRKKNIPSPHNSPVPVSMPSPPPGFSLKRLSLC